MHLYTPNTPALVSTVMAKLIILFIGVPLVELALIIKVGGIIGWLNTIFIALGTGALGAYLMKMQGLMLLWRIQEALNEGRMPADELIEGALLLVGGALLLTPGFITDAVGFALLIPPSRNLLGRWLRAYFSHRVVISPRQPYDLDL